MTSARNSTGPPPRRRLPRAVRERQMLDAAVAVFSRRGYHLASMDEISEEAGVSKPMIYAYLGAKEDLFLACIRREAERMMTAIAEAVQEDVRPDEQLWRGLLAFFRFVAEHRDGWIVLYHQGRGLGPFADEIAGIRERMTMAVAGMLAGDPDAGPADSADPGSTPLRRAEPIAHALVGAAEALSDWGLQRPDETPEELTTRLMDLAWTGLGGLVRGERWGASRPVSGE